MLTVLRCAKEKLQRPFTKEVFEWTRAEVLDPRIEPGDLAMINSTLNAFCAQFRALASEAHRSAAGVLQLLGELRLGQAEFVCSVPASLQHI